MTLIDETRERVKTKLGICRNSLDSKGSKFSKFKIEYAEHMECKFNEGERGEK